MASGKRNKSLKIKNTIDLKKLTLSDVICPVCRSILIEPVSLPCSHVFCSACFNGSIENNSLTCPICRRRIGSWLRSATKLNNIINQQLWDYIKDKFHEEVEAKSRGDDVDTSTIDGPLSVRLSLPGEIRKEYELELANQQQQLIIEKQKEINASEAYIRKLHEDEIKLRLETKERIRKDTEIAKQIARGLSFERNGTSTFHSASDQTSNEPSAIAGSSIVVLENIEYSKHPQFGHSNIKINLPAERKRAPNMFYRNLKEKSDEHLDYCAQNMNNNKHKDSSIQTENGITGNTQEQASTSFAFVKSLASKFSKGTEKIKRGVINILNNQVDDNYGHSSKHVEIQGLSVIHPSIARTLLNELAQTPSRLRESVDSIRSEVRYFKPISPQRRTPYKKLSNGKRPSPQQPFRLRTIRKVPKYSINLYTENTKIQLKGPKTLKKHASKHSAFASGKSVLNKLQASIANNKTIESSDDVNNSIINTYKKKSVKRTTRSMNKDLEDDSDVETSPPKKIKKLSTNGIIHSEASTSKVGLCSNNNNSNAKKSPKKNGIIDDDVKNQQKEIEKILAQERRDLELAKKLQEEWNNSKHNHNTRNNLPGGAIFKKEIKTPVRNKNKNKRTSSSRISPRKKQMTLDAIFSPKRN